MEMNLPFSYHRTSPQVLGLKCFEKICFVIRDSVPEILYGTSMALYDIHLTIVFFKFLGDFDCLVVKFRFYRFLAYYFLRDFFPCILIVVLSWMTFWIDYSSTPARVAMGITTVLTIVTMTNAIRNNSPPAGLFRSVDYYLLMCNLFVFAALLEYALVGLMVNKSKQSKKKSAKESGKGVSKIVSSHSFPTLS